MVYQQSDDKFTHVFYNTYFLIVLGIACIHLAFVDGKGHPVQLLGSPKPSPGAYKELSDKSLYESLLQISKYEFDPKQHSSKSPGGWSYFC